MGKHLNFIKCHGYKIAVVIIMLGIDISFLIQTLNIDPNDSIWAYLQSSPQVAFTCDMILCILMLIPPIVMLFHIIGRCKEKFYGHGDWSDPIIAVLKALGFIAGYVILFILLYLLDAFIVLFIA